MTGRSWVTEERPSTRSACGRRRRQTSSISRNSARAISSGRWAATLEAESLTRVLYPDDSTTAGQGLRFVQEYFLVACSLADFDPAVSAAQQRLEQAAGQGRHSAQ